MADSVGLPPGFVLDAAGLPPGFVPDPMVPQSSLMTEFKDLPKGVVQGLGDVAAGGTQLVTGGNNQAVNDYIQRREQGIPNSSAFSVGRGIGNAVAGLPLAAIAGPEGFAARLLMGGAEGAASGALQPATPGQDFWTQKAEQAGAGALGGATGQALMRGLGRIVSGATNPDLKTLSGVTMTPGQIAGGPLNDIEQKLTVVPGIGDAIAAARRNSIEQMNKLAANRALSNIGESLDKGTPAGREMISQMHDKIQAAYDNLLPNLNWQADSQFVNNVSAILRNSNLLPDQAKQFTNLLQTQFSKTNQAGILTGPAYKDIESKIGTEARTYLSTSDPDHSKLGRAYQAVQAEMRDALARSNPQYADQLKSINSAYADELRVAGASAAQGAKEGVFSPNQLSASVRRLDPSLRKGAFARGEARMQDLSDATQKVLGNTIPDSGTPGRALMAMALAGLGGEHIPYAEYTLLPALGLNVAGMAAYSKPSQYLLSRAMTARPPGAEALGSALQRLSPLGAAAGGGILGRSIY